MIYCPKCHFTPLIESHELGGIPLDRCPKCAACGGTWLDAGELNLIKKQLGFAGSPVEESVLKKPAGAPGKNPEIFPQNDSPPRTGKPALSMPVPLPEPPMTSVISQEAGAPMSGGKVLKAAPDNTNLVSGALLSPLSQPADNEQPSMPQDKIIPLVSAIAGFIGVIYQIRGYIHNIDTMPLQTAQGMAGIFQSMRGFLAVTAGCILLFLFGVGTFIARLTQDRRE